MSNMDGSASHKITPALKTSTQPLSTLDSKTPEVTVDNHDNGLLSSLPVGPIRYSPSGTIYKKLFQGSFLDYWWKAIIACVFMICSLMAIILILALHQNRPLPNWPLTITINSLVSVMVVILKASMLAIIASGIAQTKWLWFEKPRPLSQYSIYDKASQGPPEAAQLLWILRGQQIIASVGALVVILAVAMDPFTQQIIQYYETTAPSDVGGNATLPRCNRYDSDGSDILVDRDSITHDMIGSIMAGLWGIGTGSYTVTASNCLTGNCTFADEYHTLAMCGSCSDLTFELVMVNETEGLNYTLPSGTTLVDGGATDQYTLMIANASFTPSTTDAPAGIIASREFIWRNSSGTGISAASCYFYLCINSYTANVTNGNLNETLVSSFPLPFNVSFDTYSVLRTDCLSSTDWAFLATQGYFPADAHGTDYLPYGETAYADITGSCIYNFTSGSAHSYQDFFNYTSDYGAGKFLGGTLSGDTTEPIGPTDILYLYNSGFLDFSRLNQTWQAIAETMSAYIRANNDTFVGTLGRIPAQGAVFYTQTLIRVDWKWLILPLVLVGLTLVCFLAIMIQTSTNGRHPFGKTFSLALLFTGVAGQVEEQIPGLPDGLFKEKKDDGKGEEEGEQNITEETKIEKKEVLIQMARTEDGAWKLSMI